MKKSSAATLCLVLVVLLAATAAAAAAAAVSCNAMELSPCLGAMTSNQAPSKDCCSKLKEQVPCFCGYMKNPMLRPYIDSPNAKRVAGVCQVPPPKC